MTFRKLIYRAASFATLSVLAFAATAADFPARTEGSWVVKDFKFHTGEVLPELRLAYTTVGDPKGQPVLVLHGTTGSGTGMLNAAFGGELFGAGQPLTPANTSSSCPTRLAPENPPNLLTD